MRISDGSSDVCSSDLLDFVVEAFGKQGAQGAVDQARSQDFFFGRTAFTLEETTGNTAGRVGFFYVVDGQGEKVLTGLGGLGTDNGRQDNGIVNRNQHGTGGLASNLAGFQNHREIGRAHV